MKKTLFLLAAALCGTASAALEVGDIVGVTFLGNNGTAGVQTDATVLGQSGSLNAVQVDGNGTATVAQGGLVDLQGNAAGITISLSKAAGCGSGGVVSKFASAGQGLSPSDVFGATITSGSNGGCVNASGGDLTMTLSGLTSGTTYDLYVLTGRGNAWGSGSDANSSISYKLAGAEENSITVTATLVGASSTSTNVVDATLNSYEYNAGDNTTASAWSLVKYSFTADESGSVTLTSSDGLGNINALALQVTPEPTTATLSLLALAGLCARRRRK